MTLRLSPFAAVRRTKLLPVVSSVAVAAAWLVSAEEAQAAGFATARFGGEHGHPTTDNPTAIYYNPAGIAEDTPGFEKKFWRFKIFVDGNVAFRWASWRHAFDSTRGDTEPDDASGANSGTGELFNVVAAPMAGATFQIENFGVGLAWFVPFGGQSVWSKNEQFEGNPNYPGPVDGVQRWHAIEGTIRSMYFSVAAAYDILDRVSIGAALNVVKSDVDTIRARTAAGTNDVDLEGRSWIDAGGWNASFGVGIIGEIAPEKVWIGFSYQARPGMGQMDLEGTLTNYFQGNRTVDNIKLLQEMPDVYRIGVRARPIKEVEIRAFGDVTTWGNLESQCVVPDSVETCDVLENGAPDPNSSTPPLINIVRRWGTTFGARVGGSYWVIPAVEVFTGAGYDSNAVPDQTLEPALTDFHKATLTGGVRIAAGELFAAALSYTHIFYVPRDTQNCGDDPRGPEACRSIFPLLEPPSKSPDSSGEYTQTIGVINANVQFSF